MKMINKNYEITFAFLTTTLFLTLGPTAAQAATAIENYAHYCTQCHGTEGKGDGVNATEEMPVSPRNHTDPKEMGKLTSEDVYFAIKDGGKSVGKSSLMPRWGGTMDDSEIKALVEHLSTLCKCEYKTN